MLVDAYDGSTCEVPLVTYQSANNPEQLQASILTALAAGVSTREMKEVQPGSPGVGRSSVSELWKSAGHKFVDALRDKDISTEDW